MTISAFRNNKKLKIPDTKMELTEFQQEEIAKCVTDPIYFIENYYYIKTIDEGKVLFKMWDFQKEFIDCIHNNRFISALMARQMGKSTCVSAYICWFIIFNKDKEVGIVANKMRSAKRVLRGIKLGYELIPKWLQQGVKEWNKENIELENGCIVTAAATSGESVTGDSLALLYVDEVAKIDGNLWEEFYTGAYPVITSGTTSKVLMTSSAKGMNHFYYIHKLALLPEDEGGSQYVGYEAKWHLRPDRDAEWKRTTIANTSQEQFEQEYENEFKGSSKTLLKAEALKLLKAGTIIRALPSIEIFHEPKPGRRYLITVDTSRGLEEDSSAFTVIDITDEVHEEVACYNNNTISHLAYPKIIHIYAKYYNMAQVLVELNDLGETVAELLFNDEDYDNVCVVKQGKAKARLGVMTSKTTRPKGCQNLKNLIENGKYIVNSKTCIKEFQTFVEINGKHQAESTFHDDQVMTLVNYAWYIGTKDFQLNNEYDMAEALKESNDNAITADMLGLPELIIDDGLVPPSELPDNNIPEKYDARDPFWNGF